MHLIWRITLDYFFFFLNNSSGICITCSSISHCICLKRLRCSYHVNTINLSCLHNHSLLVRISSDPPPSNFFQDFILSGWGQNDILFQKVDFQCYHVVVHFRHLLYFYFLTYYYPAGTSEGIFLQGLRKIPANLISIVV